jgi:4-hydroxybenzoate polyprenyltransferase
MMIKKRSVGQITLGFLLLTHPGPVAFHLLAVVVFALLATWSHPAWALIALVVVAHGAMQCSISMINDYCDRRLDALSKPGKPIVRGLVLPGEALVAGIVMIVVMVGLLLFLNPLALVISLCYLALGQAYNLGLKSTLWSGIVFALAMPLVPLYVLAGVNHLSPTAFWLVPVGFLIGVALNLANALPDVEGDKAGGAKTLAVALGVRGSFITCPLLIALSAVLMGILVIFRIVLTNSWIMTALPAAAACLAIGALALFFGPQKPLSTRKIYFYLVASTCLLLGAGWFVIVAL